jgi:thiamine biosynthesis protein ThiS
MKITVNFKPIEFEGTTLSELLALYRFNPDRISLIMNDQKLASSNFDAVQLKEGDVIEIGRA